MPNNIRQKLYAARSMRYANRQLETGDEFEASRRDARVLTAIGRASTDPIPQRLASAPTAEHPRAGRNIRGTRAPTRHPRAGQGDAPTGTTQRDEETGTRRQETSSSANAATSGDNTPAGTSAPQSTADPTQADKNLALDLEQGATLTPAPTPPARPQITGKPAEPDDDKGPKDEKDDKPTARRASAPDAAPAPPASKTARAAPAKNAPKPDGDK